MRRREITNDEILTALCCGRNCKSSNGALCHRFDFVTEAKRIRQLIDDWLTQLKEIEPS
jgi:hypothetical protein